MMKAKTVKPGTKVLVVVTYLIMLVVNSLANILPINGRMTGDISDGYANLFAPAGVTFSIWGLIYLLLGAYTLYQLDWMKKNRTDKNYELLNRVGIIFAVSSLVNAAWIFSWHYDLIPLSMVLMLGLLVCLILINRMIRKETLNAKEVLFIGLPFSIYFGWITVATIANATTLLVSLGWSGFGIGEATWTSIILVVGVLIGCMVMVQNRDPAYGFVLVWAYVGIFIKHTSQSMLAGQYQGVINTVIFCLAALAIMEVYVIFYRRKGNR